MDIQAKMLMKEYQYERAKKKLSSIAASYRVLLQKEFNNTLTRDERFIYELMDKLIAMDAIYQEATSDNISKEHVMEKLNKMQQYINAAKKQFKIKKKPKNKR